MLLISKKKHRTFRINYFSTTFIFHYRKISLQTIHSGAERLMAEKLEKNRLTDLALRVDNLRGYL